MGKYIPVDPEKWAAMVQAQSEVTRLKEEVKLLTAEVSFDKRVQLHVDKLVAEFTQCQVEKLKAELEETKDALFKHSTENHRLQVERQRLTKAGDELLHEWSRGDETNGRNFMKGLVIWNAAKEGKPSV